jgi:hypothetical protein
VLAAAVESWRAPSSTVILGIPNVTRGAAVTSDNSTTSSSPGVCPERLVDGLDRRPSAVTS